MKIEIEIKDDGTLIAWIEDSSFYLTQVEFDVEGLELVEDTMLSTLVHNALLHLAASEAPKALRPFYYPVL